MTSMFELVFDSGKDGMEPKDTKTFNFYVFKSLFYQVSIYSKHYIPIFLTVCNNVSMKNVIKLVKSVKLFNIKLFNEFIFH